MSPTFLFSSFLIFKKKKDGNTSLIQAACGRREQIVQILLERGANIEASNKVRLFHKMKNDFEFLTSYPQKYFFFIIFLQHFFVSLPHLIIFYLFFIIQKEW